MGFFDEVGKTISDAGQGALKKGKDLAGIAKYSSMITEEEKKIDELYYQIGKVYVQEHRESASCEFEHLIAEIRIAESKIKDYEEKISELKGLIKCYNCGSEIPGESTFCPVCGEKLIETVASNATPKCPHCGADVLADDKFCMSCGKPIGND